MALATSAPLVICLAVIACSSEATSVPTPAGTTRTASFTTEDGIELRGRLVGQSSTGVVLAHMFPADQSSWWDFAQILADNGYMALAFDFRGYGESDGEKELDLIHRDVEAAIEFLQEESATRIFLIGASMGGTASLKVAERQGVRGVISLSAPSEFAGLDLKDDHIPGPVLLIATEGDRSATHSIETMIEDGIFQDPDLVERVIYEDSNDHGTDIVSGDYEAAARARILGFLGSNS